MRTHFPIRHRIACACGAAVVAILNVVGCGGGRAVTQTVSPALPPQSTVVVAISPPGSAAVFPGGRITFSVSITGTTNNGVTWSIQETNGGTITSAGVYTAPVTIPANPSTFHVIATSQADTSKRDIVAVVVGISGASALRNISPNTTNVLINSTIGLQAVGFEAGTMGWAFRWSVKEGTAGGTIVVNTGDSSRAAYTAPATPGTYHVFLVGDTLATTTYGDPYLEVEATATLTVLSGATPGTFISTGNMIASRFGHTATLLHDGRVLIAGGDSRIVAAGSTPLPSTAEIYNPATGVFTATGNLTTSRGGHVAVPLRDGRVLLAGGACTGTVDHCTPNLSTETYDPVSGTFTVAANLLAEHPCTNGLLLPNGKALILGGASGPVTAEIYDPDTGTFSAANGANSRELLKCPTAILLANGKVLIVPNPPYYGPPESPIVEIFDPAAGQYSMIAPVSGPGTLDTAGGSTLTLLNTGLVLFAGLEDTTCGAGGCDVLGFDPATWLFDPATGSAQMSGSMPAAKVLFTHTLLQNGTVLLTGGLGDITRATAEIYDPKSGTFSSIGQMAVGRYLHTATLLNDGRVLIIGGVVDGNANGSTAELYIPAQTASQSTLARH